MGETVANGDAQSRSEFLRQVLLATSAGDITVSPETLKAATAYARGASRRQSSMASIQAELQVLKSLALDMKAALQAERKRLFDLD